MPRHLLKTLSHSLRRRRKRNRKSLRRHTRRQLLLQPLEDRRMLAYFDWDPAIASDDEFGNAENWQVWNPSSSTWERASTPPSSNDTFYVSKNQIFDINFASDAAVDEAVFAAGESRLQINENQAAIGTLKVSKGYSEASNFKSTLMVDSGSLIAGEILVGQGDFIFTEYSYYESTGGGELIIGSGATVATQIVRGPSTGFGSYGRLAVYGKLNTDGFNVPFNHVGSRMDILVGSNGLLDVKGDLRIGDSDAHLVIRDSGVTQAHSVDLAGVLTIEDDGVLDVAGVITLNGESQIVLDGGTIKTVAFTFGDEFQDTLIDWRSGTLELNGARYPIDAGFTPLPTSGDWTFRFKGSHSTGGDVRIESSTPFGRGSLEILDGTILDVDRLEIGENGTVLFGGVNTSYTFPHSINLAARRGELRVEDGAVVATPGASVSKNATIIVEGTGSQWNNSGPITVGSPSGTNVATLGIASGATVDSTGAVSVRRRGQLRLNQGTLSVPEVETHGFISGSGTIDAPITIYASGGVAPDAHTGVLFVDGATMSTDATFSARLNGTLAGNGYSQLDVDGTVVVDGANLLLTTVGFRSNPGERFRIINNDGTDPVIGRFAGLFEGSIIHIDGYSYEITYAGGDGNDVELISHGTLPTVIAPGAFTLDSTPFIDWTDVENAASYDIEIRNAETNNLASSATGLAVSVFTPPSDLPTATYNVLITAHDSGAGPDQVSKPRKFTVLPPIEVNTSGDTTDTNLGDGQATDSSGKASLRGAIQETNALVGDDTIILPAGTYTLTRAGSGEDAASTGDLDITDNLTIVGAGPDVTFIDGNDLDRIFDVHPGVSFTLSGVTIRDGRTSALGGGVQSYGDTTLSDVALRSNHSATHGGAIAVRGGTARLDDSLVDGNSVDGFGASGIYTQDASSLFVSNSTISNNQGGRAVYNDGFARLTSTLVDNNNGGGIYAGRINSRVEVLQSTISNNADRGLIVQDGLIVDSVITANGNGGMGANNATILRTEISNNTTGGGFSTFSSGGTISIVDSTITGNSTQSSGGGVATTSIVTHHTVNISGTLISGNTARWEGGGVSGFVNLVNSTVSNNTSQTNAGGVFFRGGSIINTTITDNTAVTESAGGIRLSSSEYAKSIGNTIIAGNTAATSHPDILVETGPGPESLGYNLIGVYESVSQTFVDGVNFDQVGTVTNPIDPLLGPLADNDGLTKTHEILAGSPAVNRGGFDWESVDANSVTVDQRGIIRPQNSIADIGAFEREAGVSLDGVVLNGTDQIAIDYTVTGAAAFPFTLAFYASEDPTLDTSDQRVAQTTIGKLSDNPADIDPALALGTHSKSIGIGNEPEDLKLPGVAEDLGRDHFLFAVVENTGAGIANLPANASRLLSGVYHAAGGDVMLHATGADNTLRVRSGSSIEVVNGIYVYSYDAAVVDNVQVFGHESNDTVRIETDAVRAHVWGGAGTDRLFLDLAGATIDFTDGSRGIVDSIETLNLVGGNENTVALDSTAVADMVGGNGLLTIYGDADDVVQLGAGWEFGGVVSVESDSFDVWWHAALTVHVSTTIGKAIEDAAPNNGDGNSDGIPDKLQRHVESLPQLDGATYLTLQSDATQILRDVAVKDNPSPSDAPEGLVFEHGFIEFIVDDVAPLTEIALTIYPEGGTQATSYYKYGPTPDDPAPHWYEFLYDGTTGAEIFSDHIVLHFVDGFRGDDDLTENGEIVDIGVPTSQALDFGDAPTPYPTVLSDDGAHHTATGPTLGSYRDYETDGRPSADADGDDTTGTPDDEDGLVAVSDLMVGRLDASLTVDVQGGSGRLDAWIDFDGDGSWGGPLEQIADSVAVSVGNNTISFDVPSWAASGETYARFRLSTAGNLGPGGPAADGEVEDHLLSIAAPRGHGTFVFGSSPGTTGNQFTAELGDLDADGDLDVFVGFNGTTANANQVWINQGGIQGGAAGHFVDSGQRLAAYGTRVVALGDLDGDGDLDALAGNEPNQPNQVWINNGNGTFTNALNAPGLGNSSSGGLGLGDLDGDGDLDAFASNRNQSHQIWLNNGNGGFVPGTTISNTLPASEIGLGDVDQDGDLDAFVTTLSGGPARVYLNDGAAGFFDSGQSLGGGHSLDVELGDLNGDGALDAVIINADGANTVWLNAKNGSGHFTQAASFGTTSGRQVALGDIDGDGDLDAIEVRAGAENRIWMNNGSGTFEQGVFSLGASEKTYGLDLGDVDNDGDLDVFFANFEHVSQVWLNENFSPTVSVVASSVTVDEGQSAQNSGAFHDLNAGDIVTLSASVGSITPGSGSGGSWTWSYDTTDGPNESTIVTITGSDQHGAQSTATFDLTVNNVAPSFGSIATEQQTLATGGTEGFGASIAIDGNLAVVGAVRDSTVAARAGAAFVYERNDNGTADEYDDTWNEVAKLAPASLLPDAQFGYASAIDGDTIVVSARIHDAVASNTGAVYVFRNIGGTWQEEAFITPFDGAADDVFGQSVDISGNTLVVGSRQDDDGATNQGTAYVYQRDASNNWNLVKKLMPSDTAHDPHRQFGHSVAIDGDTIVVGARWDTHGFTSSKAGAVFLYQRDLGGADNWGQLHKRVASDPAADDEFGYALAIEGDTLLVGSHQATHSGQTFAGAAYVLDKNVGGTDNWGELQKVIADVPEQNSRFGSSLSFSETKAIIGAYPADPTAANASGSYLFEFDGSQWLQRHKFVPAAGKLTGYSVAISGNNVLAGGRHNDSNAVYDYLVEPGILLNQYAIDEGEGVTVSGSFIDPGSADSHTVEIDWGDGTSQVAALAHGSRSFSIEKNNPYLDDQPTGSPSDSYGIAVSILDDDGELASATLDLTVNNVAPTANVDSAAVSEDSPPVSINVLGNDTDPANDPLTITAIDTTGTLGQVTFIGGNVNYDPNGQFEALAPGQTATDTFRYTIDDGDGGTAIGVANVTITGENDAPVANPDSATTDENTSLTADVLANDTDVDGDDNSSNFSLDSVSIASTLGLSGSPAPAGSVTIVANQVRFDPGTDFDELDPGDTATVTIDYTMSDDSGASSSSTLFLTVAGTNDAPQVSADFNFTPAWLDANAMFSSPHILDSGLTFPANQRTILFQELFRAPVTTQGELSESGDHTVTVQAHYDPVTLDNDLRIGLTDNHDSVFIYRRDNGIRVTEAEVDEAGNTFVNGSTTTLNEPLAINSPELLEFQFVLGATTSLTSVSSNGSEVWSGNLEFARRIDSGSAISLVAYAEHVEEAYRINNVTVSIDSPAVDEGQTAKRSGTFEDLDLQDIATITATDATGAPIGVVSQDAGNKGLWHWSYHTTDGPDESTTITVTATDVDGGQSSATFDLTVNNVAPTANVDSATIGEDGPPVTIDVLANDTDPAGLKDPLNITAMDTTGTLGAVTVIGREISYDPNNQFEWLAAGEDVIDSFGYTAGDGDGGTATATVNVTIRGVNDAPTLILPSRQVTPEDTLLSISGISVADVDSSTLTVTMSIPITTGTLLFANTDGLSVTGNGSNSVAATGSIADLNSALSSVQYPPAQHFNGLLDLSVAVSDGSLGSSTTTRIEVTPVNDPPTLSELPAVSFPEDGSDTSIDLDAFFSDVETLPEDATFEAVAPFPGVSATIDPITHVLTLTGPENYSGLSNVTIRATDTGDSSAETVTLDAVAGAEGIDSGPRNGTFDHLSPQSNFGNFRSFIASDDSESRFVFEFDISAIPSGSTIDSASLRMTEVSGSDSEDDVVELHGYAADGVATLSDMVHSNLIVADISDGGGSTNFLEVTSFVQSLVDASSSHAGFLIRDVAQSSKSYNVFSSHPNNPDAWRPKLIISTSKSSAPLRAPRTLPVTVTAVADPPHLTLADVQGNEAAAIPLPISVALADADGSESLGDLTITGVPSNATLSAGTDNGGGNWILTPPELNGLTITVADNTNFDLSVTATSLESSNSDVASTSGLLHVTVNNVVPTATIEGPTVGIEGQLITIDLAASDVSADEAAGFGYLIDWGDGQTETIIATAENGSGLTATHAYEAAASYSIVLTATDKDGGSGSTSHTISVSEITTAGLQAVIDEIIAEEGDPVISIESTTDGELGSIISSISQLSVDSATFDVVVNLNGQNFNGKVVNIPNGINLVLQNGSLQGASPALTVAAGNVIATGINFTNATDAPTILVNGGTLTLRDSIVEETTGGDQAGIEITGGLVDLGSITDIGGNTILVHEAGLAIRNTGSATVTAIGNTFQIDDGVSVTDLASPFRIEDEIEHALDASGGALVEYVAANVYVTQQSGNIQRGVDAVVAGGIVNVQQGDFSDYVVGDKLLTMAFEGGPIVTQESDVLDPTRRTISVIGTGQADHIRFTPGIEPDDVDVSINGVASGSFQPTGRLVAFGGLGNDRMELAGSLQLPGWLYGQQGDDWAKGGGGDDVLIGGDGDDLMVGKSGRDIMIGGFGSDRMVGNSDDDILIAGHSTVADNEAALNAIVAEWTSDRSYESRRANILGDATSAEFGNRLNGDAFLQPGEDGNVFDDGARDTLTGSSGEDWFFANTGGGGVQDKVTDLSADEFAEALDWILAE